MPKRLYPVNSVVAPNIRDCRWWRVDWSRPDLVWASLTYEV